MTTTLDIIDTAVKIGSGALITGVVTFIVSRQKINHEVKKNISSEKRDLLIEITRRLENSSNIRDKTMASLGKKYDKETNKFEREITDEIELLSDSLCELRLAITNCYLIGDRDLADLIQKRFTLQEKIRLTLIKDEVDYEIIANAKKELNEIGVKTRNQYSIVLDKIYA